MKKNFCILLMMCSFFSASSIAGNKIGEPLKNHPGGLDYYAPKSNDLFSGFSYDIFDIESPWFPAIGYCYRPYYPYGVSIVGGWFLSLNFADNGRIEVSDTKYYEPTWAIHLGLLGIRFGSGAINLRIHCDLGLEMAKQFQLEGSEFSSETIPYFSVSPYATLNLWMVYLQIGYEWVPSFTELNGLTWGVGLSIPLALFY